MDHSVHKRGCNPLYFHLGLSGAVLALISDIVLLGLPVSGSFFDIASFGAVPMVSHVRVAVGAYSGMLGSFLTCFAMVYFYRAHPAFHNSNLLLFSLCAMSVFSGSFHAGYYFLYHAYLLQFQVYLVSIAVVAGCCSLLSSLLIYKLCKSTVPYALRWCSPFLLSILLLILFYILPPPIGGFIRPTFINSALCLFLILQKRAHHNPN